jgi:cytochrome c oxidase subunit 2
MLVLPTDTPIRFLLQSPDVVHNFYVPRFMLKRDVVPGRTNVIDVTIDRPGEYRGVCAEFCGLLHDQMNFTVRAVSAPEFETWSTEQEEAARGEG